ncbi:MAG: hypothetical protein ACRD3E_09305 [Terriglobales bacterium]
MKSEDIFDIVHERVREYRALSDRAEHYVVRSTRTQKYEVKVNGRTIRSTGGESKKIQRVSTIASRGHITAIRPDACAKDGPPKVGNVRHEYIADFQLAGERALANYPKRFRAFVLYYVEGTKRDLVIRELSLRDGTFDRWCDHIRKSVGEELRTTDLYPPRMYRRRTDLIPGN